MHQIIIKVEQVEQASNLLYQGQLLFMRVVVAQVFGLVLRVLEDQV
jgi:demethoxyubiquinone hydroxylase (CLK1/Coq7/Cat5 family)